MRHASVILAAALAAAAPALAAQPAPAVHVAQPKAPPPPPPVPVNPDTFPRAESDLNFAGLVKEGGFGKFIHRRDPVALDHQGVTRMNRDTLYSAAVFDLDAGPVTITLPDPGRRFFSLQIVDEDADTTEVVYAPGPTTITRATVGSRYALAAVRIFVDAGDPKDLDAVRALQNAITVAQPGGPGAFVIPNWDAASQVDVRSGLMVLAETLPDTKGMFGARGAGDPVRRLIGAGAAWGGLPQEDALFVNVVPERNDGATIHRLTLKDVPADGPWSVSVYDSYGRFAPNPQKAYTVSSATAVTAPDGAVVVQFGGCDGHVANCLPTPPDWSYVVRLYRPRAAILAGTWKLPEAQPLP
ncbi:DUF1254 domain-containing protein [Roseiarcus fermentans]|nr:DUF1254 domain-containing protein [Roseiarcus fermentans]